MIKLNNRRVIKNNQNQMLVLEDINHDNDVIMSDNLPYEFRRIIDIRPFETKIKEIKDVIEIKEIRDHDKVKKIKLTKKQKIDYHPWIRNLVKALVSIYTYDREAQSFEPVVTLNESIITIEDLDHFNEMQVMYKYSWDPIMRTFTIVPKNNLGYFIVNDSRIPTPMNTIIAKGSNESIFSVAAALWLSLDYSEKPFPKKISRGFSDIIMINDF